MQKILIVDDSHAVRLLVARLVRQLDPDCDIVALESAELALAYLEGQLEPPDLALIDYTLPGMDGLSLARAMNALSRPPMRALFTANIQDAVAVEARDLGMIVLRKPIDRATIAQLITKGGSPR